MTKDELLAIMPLAKSRVDAFLDPINAAMSEFSINTPLRQASFLAQLAHESGQLRYMKELASGAAYEHRRDLGNTVPGDGVRFKGRGPIQITGKSNYVACGMALDLDLLARPELLEVPEHGCRSAAWFWNTHGLNELADSDDQVKICKRINGGTNGLAERLVFFQKAMDVLL